MDIENLETDVLQETDINRLYEIQIDLSKRIKNAHRQNLMAETIMEQTEAKGNLGIFYSMQEILQSRIPELKEKEKDERNESNRINYNFRMSAKTILKRETYDSIMDLAMKTRREAKEQQNDLRKNKLE